METYNEKYLKGAPLVADFLLHDKGVFILHNTWDLRCSRVMFSIFSIRS